MGKRYYVIPVHIHIPADSAEDAEALVNRLDGSLFDAGPVTLSLRGGGASLALAYVNAPVTEADCAYTDEDLGA